MTDASSVSYSSLAVLSILNSFKFVNLKLSTILVQLMPGNNSIAAAQEQHH